MFIGNTKMILSFCMMMLGLPKVAGDCFVGKSRFPKMMQGASGNAENAWMAITSSSSLNAIFVGGFTKTSIGLANSYFPTPTHTAAVARINTDTNLYAWRVALASNDEPLLELVTALSIQVDDESKIAVVASKWTADTS